MYTCIGYVIPAFLQSKNYVNLLISLVALIVFGGLLHNWYIHYMIAEQIGLDPAEKFFNWEHITKRMTYLNSPMLFGITLVMLRSWYQEKEKNSQMSKDKLEAELHLLKNQLHPHFFFNTLNNLYSLALQRSEETPPMILRLSALMRYLTDQNNTLWVSLKDEIHFIENYISLEKIRYQDKVIIRVQILIAEPERVRLPPMILATFIENGFKHGVSETTGAAYINVLLEEDDNWLYYSVKNNKGDAHVEKEGPKTQSGIGLVNLKKRLEIIFDTNFDFQLAESIDSYTAYLKIPKKYEAI